MNTAGGEESRRGEESRVGDAVPLYHRSVGGSPGEGPPLVLLGGLGTGGHELAGLIEPLAARRRVVAVDSRGSGRSPAPPGPYSVEQLAGDVVALLDRLGLAQVDVLGLSLGGRIGLALALDHPGRVRRLVLAASGPRAADGLRWRTRLGMLVANLPVLRGAHPAPARALRAQFDASTRFDATPRLGQVAAPTLVVHGRHDRTAPLALAELAAARIPGARLVVVDGGHRFPLVRPDLLVAAVDDFLVLPSATTE